MGKTFEVALMDLINEHLERGEDRDEIISAMEINVMAMKDEDAAENDD